MKRLKVGDVFKIDTPNGRVYFQYCFHDKSTGNLIRILPGLFEDNPNNLDELVNFKEMFFIFFPLTAAYKQGIIKFIGNFELPKELKIPQYMRSKVVDKNGKLINWQIVNCESLKRETVNELTIEQKNLSPWGTWNDTLLIERLSEGWTLENW